MLVITKLLQTCCFRLSRNHFSSFFCSLLILFLNTFSSSGCCCSHLLISYCSSSIREISAGRRFLSLTWELRSIHVHSFSKGYHLSLYLLLHNVAGLSSSWLCVKTWSLACSSACLLVHLYEQSPLEKLVCYLLFTSPDWRGSSVGSRGQALVVKDLVLNTRVLVQINVKKQRPWASRSTMDWSHYFLEENNDFKPIMIPLHWCEVCEEFSGAGLGYWLLQHHEQEAMPETARSNPTLHTIFSCPPTPPYSFSSSSTSFDSLLQCIALKP